MELNFHLMGYYINSTIIYNYYKATCVYHLIKKKNY